MVVPTETGTVEFAPARAGEIFKKYLTQNFANIDAGTVAIS
jgi:hypothetical protein